ncbi:MAG: hypothetical protein NG712_05740 [Omnitrophica bacterium]|nr:hypothetical protein [Candidatus Omnitrophota bacterium]
MGKIIIPWKKVGVIFSIIVVCFTAFAGYCDTKFKTNETAKDLVKLEDKVEKGFENIHAKMNEFSREQVTLRVQTSAILEAVSFLKKKAQE